MTWLVLALCLLIVIIWAASTSIHLDELVSRQKPLASYEEAIAHIRAMQEQDNRELARDVCITKLYDHGKQTEHVIILLHGFTNCPEQVSQLGNQYFEAGHNVFLPRMPYHGLSDRLTDALAHLTAENLARFGDTVIDVAHGLGRKITVLGISASGTLVAWLAQNRSDIDFAFAISPLFGLAFVPQALTKLFERIALLLPNFYMWWDPRTKANNPYSIYYAYPGYPMHALVEIIRLAMITRAQAGKFPPKAAHSTMIINDAEPAVSNAEILKLITLWRKQGAVNLTEVHFEKEMKLPHDILTPGTPGLPTGDIYPRLIGAVRAVHADRKSPW